VSIYEKEAQAGGLIKYVIPDFRMDKSALDYEVDQLSKMGVNFFYNSSLGSTIQLDELTKKYDSVILALGLGKAKKLDVVKNISESKYSDALSFLVGYNLRNLPIKTSSRILVIGGGNSAIDAARSAKIFDSTNSVYVACVETEDKMPAFGEEVEHAKAEGIQIYNNLFIDSCVENDNIELMMHAFDTKEFKQKLEVDYIVVAIGQTGKNSDYELVGEDKLGEQGKIKADEKTGFSNYENVFVAGDVCDGNHMSLIGAIASGKKAAIGVRQKLENYEFEYEGLDTLLKLNDKESEGETSEELQMNGDINEFISKFNLFQSCEKCNHCIDNLGCPAMIKVDGKIQIDYPKCTKCGLCIDVCPNDAIQWVKEKELVNE